MKKKNNKNTKSKSIKKVENNSEINKSKYAKYLLFLPFFVPIALFIGKFAIDNDFWFTINQGKYVIENGLPDTVINVIHEGLAFLYQSSGTGILFYLVYNYLGNIGIMFMTLIMLELIAYFYYKLCLLVSKNNYRSIILTTLFMLIFLLYTFPRPHLFTVFNLVLILYLLEKYIKENNYKYLIPVPFIYLLQVYMHGIYYVPLLIFITPYLLNSFKYKFEFLNQGPVNYNKKPLFIMYLASILIGFLNPYTYKVFTYGFSSYGQTVMKQNINELGSINFNTFFGKICIITIIVTFLIYIFNRKKKIPLRYYLLLLGTTVLALDAYKSFYLFMACSFFPIAYIYREEIEQKISKKAKIVTAIIILVISCITIFTTKVLRPPQQDSAEFLVEYNKIEKPRVYTSFEDGSYYEYKGFDCYIDPRAELFLKSNNKKFDIIVENFDMQHGVIAVKDFLDKYNFDYLVVKVDSDAIYTYLQENPDNDFNKIYDKDKYQIWEKK